MPTFQKAFPYQKDVLSLPVVDIDRAAEWYGQHFGMKEVERSTQPVANVILERDDVRLGFSVNGGDASQDGAAILVADIAGMKQELESTGITVGDLRTDNRDGVQLSVFFVVAPDGLCFYFHEPAGDG